MVHYIMVDIELELEALMLEQVLIIRCICRYCTDGLSQIWLAAVREANLRNQLPCRVPRSTGILGLSDLGYCASRDGARSQHSAGSEESESTASDGLGCTCAW